MRMAMCLLCWLLMGYGVHAEEFQTGMLKQVLGTAQGEPGQVVQYRPSPTNDYEIEVIFEGDTLRHEYNYIVVPLDSAFTVSWAYLRLTGTTPLFSQKPHFEDRHRFLLAKNVAKQFPTHFLHEEMLAQVCTYAEKVERHESFGMSRLPKTLDYIKSYLDQYPEGKYKDALDWRRVQLENHVYEFEGYAHDMVKLIGKFETYLQQHPETEARADIVLRIARFYRMAYECVVQDPQAHAEFLNDKDSYVQRAKMYYEGLLDHENLDVRETARTALYSMQAGRRIYINSNDW